MQQKTEEQMKINLELEKLSKEITEYERLGVPDEEKFKSLLSKFHELSNKLNQG